jgi:hypothetical protein
MEMINKVLESTIFFVVKELMQVNKKILGDVRRPQRRKMITRRGKENPKEFFTL